MNEVILNQVHEFKPEEAPIPDDKESYENSSEEAEIKNNQPCLSA